MRAPLGAKKRFIREEREGPRREERRAPLRHGCRDFSSRFFVPFADKGFC
jgi:hypothetical protein